MKKSAQVYTGRSRSGFTLVELLVVIAVIAILAAVVILIINPAELLKRGRDTTRLSDMDNLQKAISTALADASSPAATLCYNIASPTVANCLGLSTDANPRKNDGTGWIKVNFSTQAVVTISTLPLDPTNSATYHYSYVSDGTNFELNAVLESAQYTGKMSTDGGDNVNIYEVGSKLNLLN